jgi:hypothetical protein
MRLPPSGLMFATFSTWESHTSGKATPVIADLLLFSILLCKKKKQVHTNEQAVWGNLYSHFDTNIEQQSPENKKAYG